MSEIETIWELGLSGGIAKANSHLTKNRERDNNSSSCPKCGYSMNNYSSCSICPKCGTRDCGD